MIHINKDLNKGMSTLTLVMTCGIYGIISAHLDTLKYMNNFFFQNFFLSDSKKK